MNHQNKDRALFDAISGIDDAYIEEAAAPRVLPMTRRLLRLGAAVAALAILLTVLLWTAKEDENVVTAPGFLPVYTFDLEEPKVTEENRTALVEGITLPISFNWATTQNYPALGYPLYFHFSSSEYADMRISYEIILSSGSFMQEASLMDENGNWLQHYEAVKKRHLGDQFTITNDKYIFWRPWKYNFDNDKKEVMIVNDAPGFAFVDIIIRANSHIIGYAVVEIYEVNGNVGDDAMIYNAQLLKTVSFPKIHGHFQSVSEQYVKEQFESIHMNS